MLSLLGLLILVEVVTLVLVLASQRFASEQALHDYAHELLQNVADETRENAASYLRRAQDSVSLAAGTIEAGLFTIDEPERLENFFLQQLTVLPQIDAIFLGDQEGSFVFSKRDLSQARNGFLSKFIRAQAPASERVSFVKRDAALDEISRFADPEDRYDPRDRPWYESAIKAGKPVWTDPYIFFTSQQPGLTVARAVRDDNDKVQGVVGADIELSALSEFLTTQKVGETGAAFIVHSNGGVLAHPGAAGLVQSGEHNQLRLKQLDELDAVSAHAGRRLMDRFPDLITLDHTYFDTFELEGRHYLSMFVPLLSHGRNRWVMGVYAPEDELAQTIREGQRKSIFLGVATSLLTITAALLFLVMIARPINALQQQAREDPLTGLLNRRSFGETAEQLLTAARRNKQVTSAIMIDIDRFKPINDQHGHAVGDEVLLVVARRIARGLSNEDLLARYGGEEFVVLLPDTGLHEGRQVAERLRELVGNSPVITSVGELHVTISLGVANGDHGNTRLAALLDAADRGLLQAKRLGRNQVVSMPPGDSAEQRQ
jgi:diguanylate cyclase (GGDEF)-like protein